ncbi:MAG: TIGR02302 family protein [Hyphomicrobiales bacterium]|nr:TIGR02302 family protein [Hyphomicrobiales bacterium]
MPIIEPPQRRPDMPPQLRRAARQAAGVLMWEQLWPVLAALLVLAGLFFSLSYAGLWLMLPRLGRIIGVVAFGFTGLAILVQGARLRWPGTPERLSRLDRDSGSAHHPASGLVDALANPSADQATGELWAMHLRRLARAASAIRVKPPRSPLARLDPFALRAGVLVALVASAIVAGSQRDIRVAAAFDWREAFVPGPGFRVDAWLNPPAYTGRPPLLVKLHHAAAKAPLAVPVNSQLVVQAAHAPDFRILAGAGLKPLPPGQKAAGTAAKFLLTQDARVSFSAAGSDLGSVSLHAIPDRPPTIILTAPPKANARGTLTLAYKTGDDYGVTGVTATFTMLPLPARLARGRALVGPPATSLPLPGAQGGIGETSATIDLTKSPYAGLQATLVLSDHDAIGQKGLSQPVTIRLPQRPFSNPLARALVEQRRNLLLDADHPNVVGRAFEALLIAPATFHTPSSAYVGMRHVVDALERAPDDARLRQLGDFIWQMALDLEDGHIPQAELSLRNAQEKLRRALQRGASPAEIARLSQQLRSALDKFMAEMAKKAARDAGKAAPRQAEAQGQGKIITPKDLQSMMDRLQQMAEAGDTAGARKLLDEMQKILENLRTAKNVKPDARQQQMDRAMGALDKLTRQQQALRDDTFRQDETRQDQNRQDRQGQIQARSGLARRQQALRDALNRLEGLLPGQSGKAGKALGDAARAMGQAEQALKNGPPGSNPDGQGQGRAVDAQGQALQALRRGAQALADAMAKGQGMAEGQGQQGGRGQQGQNPGQDPLGREIGRYGKGDSTSRMHLDGLPAVERARRVLEELRQRLSRPDLAPDERAYLQRLLRHQQ